MCHRAQFPNPAHLVREFMPGVCCNHLWIPVSMDASNTTWLQKNFEETEITNASVCTVCGATCLIEDNKVWAYDGTSQAFGYPKSKVRHASMAQARREEMGRGQNKGRKSSSK